MDKLVLVIDQDARERRDVVAMLWEASFQVVGVASTIQGMVELLDAEPALIVMAEETYPLQLHEVVRHMHRLTGAPVMVIGSGGMTEEVDLLMRGADFYLGRPFTASELISRARMLARRGEACWEGMETGLWAEQPLEELSSGANGRVRPIGMRVVRRDEERFTKEDAAAA
jgi:DNA-binding response OmpR family regulator